jgi:hypothetical protein
MPKQDDPFELNAAVKGEGAIVQLHTCARPRRSGTQSIAGS